MAERRPYIGGDSRRPYIGGDTRRLYIGGDTRWQAIYRREFCPLL